MKNYMKYCLLMVLVIVASAEILAEDEREVVRNDQTVHPEYDPPVRNPL